MLTQHSCLLSVWLGWLNLPSRFKTFEHIVYSPYAHTDILSNLLIGPSLFSAILF